jgi:sodium transport system permease protein
MSWPNIATVYRKELRDSLRDRRTVISMIVIPVLVMPLLTIGLGVLSVALFGKALQETPVVMVLGGEDSPQVLAALRARAGVRIVPAQRDYAAEILDRRIRAAVEIPRGFDAAVARGEPATVRIYMFAGELRSGLGADKLQEFFGDLRDRTVRARLASRQIPESLVQPFQIEQTNVASAERIGGTLLGGLVPYFLVLFCVTGAMIPAIDLTAGEKERGTIETILCSPVARADLVLGKFFMVLTASLFAAALSMLSMVLTLSAARALTAHLPLEGASVFQVQISPQAIAMVFLMVVPLAVFFSAALLALALFAKSYKEAQSYLAPLLTLAFLPAVVSLLPGVELSGALSLVPVLNTSLVSKEMIAGNYHWNYIALIFVSSCVYAACALRVAVWLFQREEVLFRT